VDCAATRRGRADWSRTECRAGTSPPVARDAADAVRAGRLLGAWNRVPSPVLAARRAEGRDPSDQRVTSAMAAAGGRRADARSHVEQFADTRGGGSRRARRALGRRRARSSGEARGRPDVPTDLARRAGSRSAGPQTVQHCCPSKRVRVRTEVARSFTAGRSRPGSRPGFFFFGPPRPASCSGWAPSALGRRCASWCQRPAEHSSWC